jgi:hypothetical protein
MAQTTQMTGGCSLLLCDLCHLWPCPLPASASCPYSAVAPAVVVVAVSPRRVPPQICCWVALSFDPPGGHDCVCNLRVPCACPFRNRRPPTVDHDGPEEHKAKDSFQDASGVPFSCAVMDYRARITPQETAVWRESFAHNATLLRGNCCRADILALLTAHERDILALEVSTESVLILA